MFVIVCVQHNVEIWLNLASMLFEGMNTLIVLNDCAASKDVKGRMGQLVNLGFSAPPYWHQHVGADPEVDRHHSLLPRECCYTPSAKTTKAIFNDYAGELSQEEYKGLISKLKAKKFSHLVFSLHNPYRVEFSN